jgi:hypothetical protein
MILDHGGNQSSRWAAAVSVASKIGCSAHTLNERVKKATVASGQSTKIWLSSAMNGFLMQNKS